MHCHLSHIIRCSESVYNRLPGTLIKLQAVIALLAFTAGLHSQHHESFDHLSVNEGLSQSTVYAIAQDHKGFIWFGTRGGGVNRYDGIDFKVFKNNPDDHNSLSDNEVISILEDSREMLWIGTRNGGLNRFNWTTGDFKHYNFSDSSDLSGSGPGRVNVIFEDHEGRLLVGLNDRIAWYDMENDRFIPILQDQQIGIRGVTGISEDNLGNLYFATWDRLIKFNIKTSATEYLDYPIDSYTEIGGRRIPVLVDSHEALWIGTPTGLRWVETQPSLRFSEELPIDSKIPEAFSFVRTITETSDGYIWFGTLDGLFRLNYQTRLLDEFHSEPDKTESLSHNSIYSMFEDRVGSVWIGTWSGVDILDDRKYKFSLFRHQINNPRSLNSNIVSSFQEDGNGIWIGTEQGGLNYMDRATSSFQSYVFDPQDPGSLRANNVKSLFIDSRGDLWVGTFYGGLSRLDRKTGKFTHDLSEHAIYTIQEIPDGKLWIGTMSGLKIMDLDTRTIRDFDHPSPSAEILKHAFVTQLFIDSDRNLWLGTRRDGLFHYNVRRNELIHFKASEKDTTTISSDNVITICEDKSLNLWIGTNNGLNRFDREESVFLHHGRNIGLEDNVINGLLPDDLGNIWIATNKGLYRFNMDEGKISHYDYRDGLQSNEFNRAACFKSSAGELFFGGIHGFNSFYADDITENRDKPQVIITDFKLFNKSVQPGEKNSPLDKHISETDHIILNYRQSYFSLEFVALNYLKPEKNNYAYRLEGYDDNWNYTNNVRSATYMNLEPGHYVFRVIGSNNDNIWNEDGASLIIHVKSPYWRTPLALALYAMLIAGMIWLLLSIVAYRERKENELKIERLEKERLKDINQMKLQFFTNISHEFRTPLTLITGPLDKLIQGKAMHPEYLYSLMKSNVNRMLRLVNQLMDFRKIENEKMELHIRRGDLNQLLGLISLGFEDLANRKMIEFNYHPNPDNPEGIVQWYDESIVDKVVYNLLSNAFKFTPEQGIINLRLILNEDMAEIIVQDTGKGIAREKLDRIFERFYSESSENYEGTGIGLSLSKRLIDTHRGEIRVESEKDKGSSFMVRIPVNRESYTADEIISDTEPLIRSRTGLDEDTKEFFYHYEPNSNIVKTNKKLLIVEDNEELLRYLMDHFSEFQTQGFMNGREALQWAIDHIPDLIISDVMMPEMDGVEFCRQLKENYITSHIPIILLTARSAVEQKIEGLKSGADSYVEKPFDSNHLSAIVENLLAQRKKLREKFSESPDFILDEDMLRGPDKAFLEKIEETVTQNISDPDFSVEKLLLAVHMSRSQLYRKFKALLNKNPSEYIRILRLKYAANLLMKHDCSVNEVAYKSGFENVSYFITCFKKYYGKSPGKYIES